MEVLPPIEFHAQPVDKQLYEQAVDGKIGDLCSTEALESPLDVTCAYEAAWVA